MALKLSQAQLRNVVILRLLRRLAQCRVKGFLRTTSRVEVSNFLGAAFSIRNKCGLLVALHGKYFTLRILSIKLACAAEVALSLVTLPNQRSDLFMSIW